MILRPYQQEAVDAVYRHLQERDDNPCVVIPTAGGKSPILAAICRDSVLQWNGRVLILAHVKELLEQNSRHLFEADPDLALKVGIYSAGLKCRDTEHPVIVAGIQSVYKRACELDAFDLIIVDEVHMVPADGEGMYRQFLSDMKAINPNVRVIGLTATPFRMKSGMICAPENILNHVCYEVGVRELIVQGFLCPLKTKSGTAKADTSNLHVRAGEFVAEEVETLMDTEHLVESACTEIVELTSERKSVLVFAAGIAHANHVAEVLRGKYGADVATVFGDTPYEERDSVIKRFKTGGIKFLVNVNVLTTGFDAPNVDCIVLLRPTMSPGLYYQMVGRGFRIHPEKSNCIAEGQRVLTNRGLIPIEQVTTDMRVWDGITFVRHHGVICQGIQEVITYAGLTATPDHKVWTEKGWKAFGQCAIEQTPIIVTGIGRQNIRKTEGHFRNCNTQRGSQSPKHLCSMYDLRRTISEGLYQSCSLRGGMSKVRTTTACPKMACVAGIKRKRALHESSQSTLLRLRGTRHKVPIRDPDCNGGMGSRELGAPQRNGNRPYQQRRALRTREFAIFIKNSQSVKQTRAQAYGQVTCFSTRISPSEILRRHHCAHDRRRNELQTNCRKIQPTFVQTQRRVWDILNAGPRHCFTVEGLLVSNCLILDYGGNVLRHGPVDAIKIKEPGSNGGGEAPAKECPQCHALVHAAYSLCPECGYEFPPPEKNTSHDSKASSESILSGEVSINEYPVQEVFYSVHEKRDAPPDAPLTMRVDYQVGWQQYHSEWVCFEHAGYARRKAEVWWKQRCKLRVPDNIEDAVYFAQAGALAKTKSITVRSVSGEKFSRITGYDLGEKPDYREPGWDEELDEVSQGEEIPEEEIPF
jgi:superfamily II DNA or RNA helicase